MDEILGTMTKEQMYRWKASMYEYLWKEKEYECEAKHFGLLEKDLEIARLRSVLFKSQVQAKKDTAAEFKRRYDEVLDQLKEELGFDIKGKVIDDITLEVKDVK